MIIRKAIKDDIKQIAIIEAERFPHDPWTFKQWNEEFENNEFSTILVAIENDEVIGYIDYWVLFEQATINKVCVSEKKSHQGIANQLMKIALDDIDDRLCHSTTLEVRVSNEKAIRLYQKNLFKSVLRKPHYYSDGEDCYYMLRSIGDVYER